MNNSTDPERTKGDHLVMTTNGIRDGRTCEKDDQCGQWAECVSFHPLEPKRCWCVHDLESPDPDTGGCHSVGSGHHHDRTKNGVLSPDHLQEIVRSADGNVTVGDSANETSRMLQLQKLESPLTIAWSQIILLGFGSLLCVSILVLFIIIYRRRFMIKQYCANRHNDVFTRHSDGVILLDRMNHIKSNPTYFCHNNVLTRRLNVPEISGEHLQLEEVVGEGAFGQVFKGNLFNPETATYRQVAVKVLRDGTTPEAREDFDREVRTMSAFDHDNILKLLGVVVQGMDGNPYMIFEYMEHGDLSELLRKNDPILRSSSRTSIVFNKADLVDVCVQIANGMSYLAARRFVHRDLATRNCLVGNGLIVKISDFGMSRDIYTSDYYKVGGSRMLPVRWMSPEAIKYGRFTCESDIWAYGVVLWEIFSYGKQPYCGHTNDEVIHFLEQGILLQRPEDCPSVVYHVMLGCWKKDPRERIVFERLAKYLTDFRDRLAKPTPSPLQTCPGAASTWTKFQNSELNVYIVEIPEKGTCTAEPIQNQYTQQIGRSASSENRAIQLNYIRVGNFANTDSAVSIPTVGKESPRRTMNVCEAKWTPEPDAINDCSAYNTASNALWCLKVSDKLHPQYNLIIDSFPSRNGSKVKDSSLQDVHNFQQQIDHRLEQIPVRKTSSCPLYVQTDKQFSQHTDKRCIQQADKQNSQQTDKQYGQQKDKQNGQQTDKQYGQQKDKQNGQESDTCLYTNQDIYNKHQTSREEGSVSSQTSRLPKCPSHLVSSSSSSVHELCPPGSSQSDTPSVFG